MLRPVVWYKFTDVSEVLAACIVRQMEEDVNTFEMSINVFQMT
jgi:hypothetical protein